MSVQTIAEFAALPPGEDRLELVRGRLVPEPPAVRAPDAITLLREGDALEGGEVLAGFRVAVADLFRRGTPDSS